MSEQKKHNMPDLIETVRLRYEPSIFRMYLLSREGYLLTPLREWLSTRGEAVLRHRIIKKRRIFMDFAWYHPPFGAR